MLPLTKEIAERVTCMHIMHYYEYDKPYGFHVIGIASAINYFLTDTEALFIYEAINMVTGYLIRATLFLY